LRVYRPETKKSFLPLAQQAMVTHAHLSASIAPRRVGLRVICFRKNCAPVSTLHVSRGPQWG
jgi:hypothetical protein